MLQSNQRSKILDYLKTRAPYSVVDAGINHASDGSVVECSKSGNTIHGVIRSSDETTHTVAIVMSSAHETEATCSCSKPEEMQEQWCYHAVSLLWRASELGFLDSRSGFVAPEAVHRVGTSSPQEIAEVIREISQTSAAASQARLPYEPNVSIALDVSSDRLGVQVLFDDEPQAPSLFEGFSKLSSRALDNILLKILDEEGSWDEDRRLWFVNSSDNIETVLGLIGEYKKIVALQSGRNMSVSTDVLEARLTLDWHATGLELSMEWVFPDGHVDIKQGELIGTGPYWTAVANVIYPVSPSASRIASLFPHSSVLSLPKSKVGPILEEIRSNLFDPQAVKILHPQLQPASEVRTPTPQLEVSRREINPNDPYAGASDFELAAVLDFAYPTPGADENVVYLPDRAKERDSIELLRSLGFSPGADRRSYTVKGDAALDVIHQGSAMFPRDWEISGVDAVKKAIRFADLAISIAITSPSEAGGKQKEGSRIDWFDCQVTLAQNNAHVPLSTLFKNARPGSDRWVRLDSGAFARVPGGGLGQLRTTLGLLDPNFRLTNTIKTRLSMAQAVSFGTLNEDFFDLTIDSRLKTLTSRLREFHAIEAVKPTKSFTGKLRSYQLDGLSWFSFLHQFDLGGILADEMGLGKTVQALAFIQAMKEKRTSDKSMKKPVLVVAPTSVITNWVYEAKRFTPKLKVLLLHGPGRKAGFSEIPEHDIIITSYALLRLDRFDLEKHEFSYIILDEAQNIKNPETATTKAAKTLRARGRIALSGTPTENRPLELWSIMDFLMPGYLGSVDFFRTYIERPILEGGPGVNVARFLNSKTKPFILRRTKAEVEKDLPPKIESSQYVSMAPSQAQLYNQILEEVRPRVFDAVKKFGIRGASVSILAALLRLRQVCNHPNSIEALKEVQGYESGKFNLLRDLVEEALASGRKILLFSQFREMLAIIRRYLDETNVNHLYLDGATRNRQELIDKFNSDSDVRLFLVSLKAGGTGLNLTAADTVIIYDPWWNPAVENQAVDRAHRIGQTKTVNVYRLITENSIEQKIMQLKAKKSRIVDALINENGLSTLSLTKDDLENLLSPLPPELVTGAGSSSTESD
ncbi:MAG: DEAD/DEAH box helicase [Oligoflexia bacterium]|nr:DEAD/DEAH box helicase [Oligoflexia bacterium]